MSGTRLNPNNVEVGKPLAIDVYDVHGKLLLMRGQPISSERQLERLLEEGLCRATGDEADAASAAEQSRLRHNRVSVLGLVREARARMAQLRAVPDAQVPAAVDAIAALLERACELDTDAALASVLVQRGGGYAARHAINCAIVGHRVAAALKRPAAEQRAFLCGLLTLNFGSEDLHDALFAQQDALSDEQIRTVRAHPAAAAARLRACGVADTLWLAVVEQHHESVEGDGYPRGLRGEAIHMAAQVAALADRYCAAVTGRAYRPGLIPAIALRDIFQKSGRGISSGLVAVLIGELGLYPPGGVVELANGEVAVVIKRLGSTSKPVVKSLRNMMRKPFEPPVKRLTSTPAFAVRTPLPAEQAGDPARLEELWADSLEIEALAA